MDGFALLADFLQRWVVAPVSQQFFSLFDLNGRFGLFFLLVSYTVAYSLFRYRKDRGLTDAPNFWQFIGGAQVHLHRSTLLDIRYYFVRGILKVALVLPVVQLVDREAGATVDFKQAVGFDLCLCQWGHGQKGGCGDEGFREFHCSGSM